MNLFSHTERSRSVLRLKTKKDKKIAPLRFSNKVVFYKSLNKLNFKLKF